jgi:hypothetical protein
VNKRLKANLIKYGITIAISLFVTYSYVSSRGFHVGTLADKYKYLSDGFAIPGLMLTCMGMLLIISNEGAFNGIGWGLKYAIKALIPFGRLKKQERYSDYVEKRKGNKVTGFAFMFVVGVIDIVICLIFMVLFNQIFNQ